MRRYSSCRAVLIFGWGTLAMGRLSRNRRFYGLHPDHGLAQRLTQRLAFGIGERRLARLADGRGLLAHVRGRRVLDQRVDDGEEIRLPAPVRVAVALDQARALGDLDGEAHVARGRGSHQLQPALDERLLFAVAVACRTPRPQPGEAAHQEIAEDARGLDVHADV